MITGYELLKYVHVLMAIVAVGFNASYAIWLRRAAPVLALPNDASVEDLCQLSWGFFDSQQDLLMSQSVTLTPTFEGSTAIGGADADLIVDNCLTELKTTKVPRRGLRDVCWQLLGYSLLDFQDEFRLETVGVYFTRQRLLARWRLAELMKVLSEGQHTSLRKERKEFRVLLEKDTRRTFEGETLEACNGESKDVMRMGTAVPS